MDPYYFLNPNLHASSGARAGGIADFSADAASGPRVCKDSPGHGLPCLVMLQTVRLPDGVNGEYNLGIQGRQLGITSANSEEAEEVYSKTPLTDFHGWIQRAIPHGFRACRQPDRDKWPFSSLSRKSRWQKPSMDSSSQNCRPFHRLTARLLSFLAEVVRQLQVVLSWIWLPPAPDSTSP